MSTLPAERVAPRTRAAPRPSGAPLRIALLNDIAQIGGIEVVLLTLVRHLPRDYFTPIYLAPEPGPMAEQMRAAGAEVVPVRRPPWWTTSFHVGRRKCFNPLAILYDSALPLVYGRKLAAALQAARADVLHSSGMLALLAGGVAARMSGVPHAAHVHDRIGAAPFRWIFRRAVERLSDQVVAVSRSVAEGSSPARTEVIPNAADLTLWRGTAPLREELGVCPQHKVIGIVGRLTPWKGQRVFLDAAAQLVAGSLSRYHFVVVGDDSVGGVPGYREELERQANRDPLRGRVSFLGRRADVLDIMAACDVLVHASTKPEPFGLVLVEGMGVGVPVVASALGGPLDIITNGEDCLLVKPSDPTALAHAIKFLCDNPAEARRLAGRGAEKSRTVYCPVTVTRRFAELYERLVVDRQSNS